MEPGAQLGHYTVLAAIGKGGMGEVWRARDGKLGREVAIKTLPEEFARDADRLARFEREAKLLASMNHPNIAAIYGLEESNGTKFLVLELVEGPTLEDSIKQGPIAVEESLKVALQIAEALEAAHEKGVIHRDLKPANIKVTLGGKVKVLDFGLAKAFAGDAAEASLSNSPTLSMAATQQGVILGTAAYMSPEQARGKPVDRRSDVWSFGVVLYEMLTGRQAFPAGETVSDTLASVLKGDPDLKALPAETTPKVAALIERCLRKNVRRRLPDIAEARIEIEDIQAEPALPPPPPAPAAARRNPWPVIALASLLLAAALTAWTALKPAPANDVVKFEVLARIGQGIALGQPLSPDGRKIAFVAGPVGKPQIWVRPLNSLEAEPLAGTEGSARFAWSPDSRNLAFFADGKLKKISVDGGVVQEIAKVRGRDLAWGPGDVILVGGRGDGLLLAPAGGGQTERVTELAGNETTHDYPDFLPDGRHFLYLVRHGSAPKDWDLFVGSLDSKERQLVPGIHSGTKYSASGYLLFNRDGGTALTAQPFDAANLKITGEPFTIAEGTNGGVTSSGFATSANGSLAYLSAEIAGDTVPTWVDRSGSQLTTAAPAGDYRNIELSPDEKYVAFDRGISRDVFVLDLFRGLTSRFTTNDAADAFPVWSPASDTIAFLSSRNTAVNVAQQNVTGGNLYAAAFGVVGTERRLSTSKTGQIPTDWSRDGHYLIYQADGDIWALPMSGDSEPLRITETPFKESNARVSPNGRWIAYDSPRSGAQTDVFIRSFPKPGIEVQVSSNGGSRPRWSPDGSELFYLSPLPESQMMAVSIKQTGSGLQPAAPVSLFPAKLSSLEEFRSYDVASDGRFLMNLATTERTVLPITVIYNWAAGLRK